MSSSYFMKEKRRGYFLNLSHKKSRVLPQNFKTKGGGRNYAKKY